jgi:hypothetical protein
MVRHGAFRNPRLGAQFLAGAFALLPDQFEQRHPARIRDRFGHGLKLIPRQGGLSASAWHGLTDIKLSGRPVKAAPAAPGVARVLHP